MSKSETFITPTGLIKFPKTIVNDVEENIIKQVNVPEGTKTSWKLNLVLDPKLKHTKEILEILDEQASAIKGRNYSPYKKDIIVDKDTNEKKESGLVSISFSSSYYPKMIDSKMKECNVPLGWGSIVIVKFTTKPVSFKGKVGLGKYMLMLQVIEPKTSSFNTNGFSETEGYVAETTKTAIAWEE